MQNQWSGMGAGGGGGRDGRICGSASHPDVDNVKGNHVTVKLFATNFLTDRDSQTRLEEVFQVHYTVHLKYTTGRRQKWSQF